MVGGAGDLVGLLHLVARTVPDVALIDIKMPPTHTDEGLRAATTIRQQYPGTAVLLLSSYLESRYASALLEDHPASSGYLLKERGMTHPSWATPCAGCAQGNASSIQPSSLSSSAAAESTDPSTSSRRGSGKSSASWPKATRTTRSAAV